MPGQTLQGHLLGSSRWILLFAMVVTLLAAGAIYVKPFQYEASIVMLVQDGKNENDEDDIKGLLAPADPSRLYHLATSTEMFEHLIDRFHLYEHYGIYSSGPFAKEMAMDMLTRSVQASEPEGSCLIVTVKDGDRKMASDMANEVYAQLQRMTEAMARARIEQTMEIYSQVVTTTEAELNDQIERLYTLSATLKGPGRGVPLGSGSEDDRNSASLQLGQIVAELAAMNQDLMKAQRVQGITLAMAKADRMPEVLLIRKAQEDYSASVPLKITTTLLLVMFFTALGGVMISAIWFLHRREFKEFLLSTDDPRDA
jgi:capsular polysaccharide biosynthesis protein